VNTVRFDALLIGHLACRQQCCPMIFARAVQLYYMDAFGLLPFFLELMIGGISLFPFSSCLETPGITSFVRRHVEQKGENASCRTCRLAGRTQCSRPTRRGHMAKARGRAFRWPKQSDLPGQEQSGMSLPLGKPLALSPKTSVLVHTVTPSNELTS
jgi:hypothetical protein